MKKLIEGRKIVMIVSHEFEDVELLYPVLRLSEEGARLTLVPVRIGIHPRPEIERKPVTGRYGHTLPFSVMEEGNRYTIRSIEEISVAGTDCLIFPGGFSPDHLRIHEPTLKLVRECNEEGKIIAAICHGPSVLISAGLLNGKKVTAYRAIRDDLVNCGAEYVDAPAVRDGNIVTGRVPDDLPEFCLEIIGALAAS